MIPAETLFETPAPLGLAAVPGISLAGGWYAEPPPFLWSAGPRGTLFFSHDAVSPDQKMLLRLHVLSPAARHLTVVSDGHAPITLPVETTGPLALRVPVPVTHPLHGGRMQIEVDRSDSPAALGMSADTRCLGFRLIGLTPLPSLKLPLDLTDRLTAAATLTDGWHVPEAGGCWSAQKTARILLPAELLGGPSRLRLDLIPGPTGNGPAIRIDCRVAGRHAGHWDFAAGAPQVVIGISPADAGAGGMIPIELAVANATSPRALDLSDDDRQLGVLLRSIERLPGTPERPGRGLGLAFGRDAGRGARQPDPAAMRSQRRRLRFPLDLSNPATAAAILAGGWHAPEAGGCWSAGSVARILLPAGLLDGRSRLQLDLTPAPTGNGPAILVAPRLAGRPVASWDFADGMSRRVIEVDPGDAGPDGLILLELAIANATSPRVLGLSDDARRLGVMLHRITEFKQPADKADTG